MTEFDHVVVGAGAAGCVVASRLSEDPRVRVLLLEAGAAGELPDEPIPLRAGRLRSSEANWGDSTVPQHSLAGRSLAIGAGRGVGGGGRINYLLWFRGHPGDYDAWASNHELPGWAWQDLLPAFERSAQTDRVATAGAAARPVGIRQPQTLHQLTQRFLDAATAHGLEPVGDFNTDQGCRPGAGPFTSMIRAGRRDNTYHAYLAPVTHRPNLEILDGARVTRVELDGRHASGVVYTDGAGRTHAVRSPSVVLCAGPLRDPQLLMLSGIGPADELRRFDLEVTHELTGVGRNLHDHASVPLVWPVVGDDALWSDGDTPATERDWYASHRGPLSELVEAGAFLCVDSLDQRPDIQLTLMLGDVTGRESRAVSCVVTLLTPRSRGQVTLRSGDPLDTPAIDPHYLHDPADHEALLMGVDQAEQIFRRSPLRDVLGPTDRPPRPGSHEIAASLLSISHPVGTCRAGSDDLAVVDPSLQVRGVTGLRVIDSSVMPTIPRGNPFAGTVALAERGVELMR